MTGTFTAAQRAAVMIVGVVGVLIPGLQPQLLGGLAAEGRADAALLGNLASIELFAMGIAAGTASFVLPITRLRLVASFALATATLCDLLTPQFHGAGLLAVRGAAGLAEGVLIWIAIGLITRSAQPARWSGAYLGIQTLAQFGLSALLAASVLPLSGSSGGFVALAGATAAGLLAVPWLPNRYTPLVADAHASAGRIPVAGMFALTGVLLYLAFVVAVWVYIEPLAGERGLAPATIAAIAPLSLAMQVIGAGAATLLAGRISATTTVLLVGVANLALLSAMGTTTDAMLFLAAASAFGFLWLFAMPFQVTAVIAADPSRRAAGLIAGAQLIGSSLGPLAAALVIGTGAVSMLLWFGAACALAAVALIVGSSAGRRVASPT